MQLVSTLVLAAEEANSFFLPHDLAEAAWSGLASLIIFGLLWWKAGPALTAMARGRTQKIETEITDAERVRTDAEGRLGDVNHRIANAGDERQRILVEARQTAEALKQQIQARAEAEAEALKVRAAADIESSKTQAISDLQAEVATLALRAAEAVVVRNLDASTQSELIDGYIEQVGAGPGGTERGY
jgi:F-type H+-transporting ATPase subunit b